MSIKTVLILLVAFISSKADLVRIVAEGPITAIGGLPQQQAVALLSESAGKSAMPSVLPQIDDILSVEVLIDTDRQGSAMIGGIIQDPEESPYPNKDYQVASFLPLSVTSSGFPLVHELYLNNDNNSVIQNVREFTSTDPAVSEFTIIQNVFGTVPTGQPGEPLPNYYFLSIIILSNLESLAEGQKTIIIEGYANSHYVDETPVTTVTYLNAAYARAVSFNRTANVPEPSILSLLITSLILFISTLYVKTGFRDKRFTHHR